MAGPENRDAAVRRENRYDAIFLLTYAHRCDPDTTWPPFKKSETTVVFAYTFYDDCYGRCSRREDSQTQTTISAVRLMYVQSGALAAVVRPHASRRSQKLTSILLVFRG